MTMIDVSVASDADLLRYAVEGLSPLPGLLHGRLGEEPGLTDIWAWSDPIPLRFELQVRHLAMPCPDVLAAGVNALALRYSGVGITSSRFLQESLGVLLWLTRPADPAMRQKRSFELLLKEVRRLGPVAADLAERERDQKVRADLKKRAANMEAAKDKLPELAREQGLGVLQDAPGRRRMLDDFLGTEGGYGHFRITSELAGHPSLLLYAAFADPTNATVDVKLSERHLLRAWWVSGQAALFVRIAQATGEALGWDDWLDTAMRPVVDPLQPVREEIMQRVAALP